MRLLPFRRPQAGTNEPPFLVPVVDPPGSVRFWTDMAKRRFIRMQAMGDAVEFVAPRTRLWPGQDAGLLGRTCDPWLFRCEPAPAEDRSWCARSVQE